jgi:hypothetical protein
MESVDFLGIEELRGLKVIGQCWVAADYWNDPLVVRYRRHRLVVCHGRRIQLTDAGRQVCAGRVQSPHPPSGRTTDPDTGRPADPAPP